MGGVARSGGERAAGQAEEAGGWGQGQAGEHSGGADGGRRQRWWLEARVAGAGGLGGEPEGDGGARKTMGSGWFRGQRIRRREKERWMGKG
jgi:hypothetical protein